MSHHTYIAFYLLQSFHFLTGHVELHSIQITRVCRVRLKLVTFHHSCLQSHISPILVKLHWLPVRFRIIFKTLVIAYKAIHSIALVYIRDLITIKPRFNYSLRSNNELLLVPLGRTKHWVTVPFVQLPPSCGTICQTILEIVNLLIFSNLN